MAIDFDQERSDNPLERMAGGFDLRGSLSKLLSDQERLIINNPGYPEGDQQLTVGAAVVRLTVPSNAISAVIEVFTNSLRYTLTGRVPTAAIGHSADDTAILTLLGRPALQQFQAIREGAGDATIFVTYFS